jgi:hypothetical protein
MNNKMHWCTCRVNLAGQGYTVVEFNQFNPVSWPEVQVLMLTHGEENIFDIKPVRISETTPRLEKDRLVAKYTYRPVEQTFPGRVFRMEMLMPGEDTDQKMVGDEGTPVGYSDDAAEAQRDATSSQEPPPAGAVFKPGKHRPGASA